METNEIIVVLNEITEHVLNMRKTAQCIKVALQSGDEILIFFLSFCLAYLSDGRVGQGGIVHFFNSRKPHTLNASIRHATSFTHHIKSVHQGSECSTFD